MFKNKLNYYIISETLKSYFFVLLTLSILMWIIQAAKFLSLITESGLSISVYLKYIFFIFPKISSQLLIISFLFSLFLTFFKLQDNKEFEIYWLNGKSKIEISFLILKISIIPTLIALIFYLFLVPISNFKSREIIANSEFSMINSLVKSKNFNSPLKNLTIFVGKNDNKGNLEKVYIFEELKTIIAKKGRVINVDNKNYLELIDGFIHEKNNDNKITVIKFNTTIFDFTKYQTDVVKYPKLQERSTSWIIDNYIITKKNKNKINNEYLLEIHKRIFKPLFIPLISILCCFLLYSNNEKFNLTKLKLLVFVAGTLLIICIELLLTFSVKYFLFKYILYFSPFVGLGFGLFTLNIFLKNEPII